MEAKNRLILIILTSLTGIGLLLIILGVAIKSKFAFADQSKLAESARVGGKALIKSKRTLYVGANEIKVGTQCVIGESPKPASLLFQILKGSAYTEVTTTKGDDGNVEVTTGESTPLKAAVITNATTGTVAVTCNGKTTAIRAGKSVEFKAPCVVSIAEITYNLESEQSYKITYTDEAGYVLEKA